MSPETKSQKAVLKPKLHLEMVVVPIVGTSDLLQGPMTEDEIDALRRKREGGKTDKRMVRDPDEEARKKAHILDPPREDCVYGHPAIAFKHTMEEAAIAVPDKKITKAGVMRAIFILAAEIIDGAGGPDIGEIYVDGLVPLHTDGYVTDIQPAPIQQTVDIKYRPRFPAGWEADLLIRYDANVFDVQKIVDLVEAGGQFVGIGCMRPRGKKSSGVLGMFRVRVE